jgi:hypothetical protein
LDDKIDDLYYYLQYVKFGFGRCVRDTSRFIQNGHMNRDEALNLCKKYDGEFPSRWIDDVIDYLEISKDELIDIIDQHRNDEIWIKNNKNEWKIKWTLK